MTDGYATPYKIKKYDSMKLARVLRHKNVNSIVFFTGNKCKKENAFQKDFRWIHS